MRAAAMQAATPSPWPGGLRLHEDYLLAYMEIDDDDDDDDDSDDDGEGGGGGGGGGGEPRRKDAVDGGTTASVARSSATSCWCWLFGDSSSVRPQGRRCACGGRCGGVPTSELLAEEHSPTNLKEFVRMRSLPGIGEQLRFTYDCPDFTQYDIFAASLRPAPCPAGAGGAASGGRAPPGGRSGWELDKEAEKKAAAAGGGVKNSRGDLTTTLTIPETKIELAALPGLPGGDARSTVVDEQAITMTRSIGDLYAHKFGVIADPDVATYRLDALPSRLGLGLGLGLGPRGEGGAPAAPMLLLASDGVWDLWGFDGGSKLVPRRGHAAPGTMRERCDAFTELTRAQGEDYFGERADNLTGVLVDLSPAAAAGCGSG